MSKANVEEFEPAATATAIVTHARALARPCLTSYIARSL
jgi:hypothetical protein